LRIVSQTDVPTYVAVVGVMLAVAVAASLVPATRASRTDPLAVLKIE
jgi:ABC-type lipoprotein release transport system permease subunit